MIIATIVLVVIASACTILLATIFVLKWHVARSKTKLVELERPVSRLSHRSFSSPDAKNSKISAPIPQHTSSLFRDLKALPFRPDRPAQPWGEDNSSERVDKRRLSTRLVKAFSVQRSQYSAYSQISPPTEGSFSLSAVRPPTVPKKAFARNRSWRASLMDGDPGNRSPRKDRDSYRPMSRRAPFRKPHPFPVSPLSIHGRPDGGVPLEESVLPL